MLYGLKKHMKPRIEAYNDYPGRTTIFGYVKRSNFSLLRRGGLLERYYCITCACELFTRAERAEMTPLHADDVEDKRIFCKACHNLI